jgi:hypothetical protein
MIAAFSVYYELQGVEVNLDTFQDRCRINNRNVEAKKMKRLQKHYALYTMKKTASK